jgi:hypothetical protein
MARGKRRDTVICERCMSGDEAMYLVSSDVIHMRVCAACAEEARKLGLTVAARRKVRDRPTATSVARGGLGFEMKLGKLFGATTACLAVCVIYSRIFRNCENMKPNFLPSHRCLPRLNQRRFRGIVRGLRQFLGENVGIKQIVGLLEALV